MNHQYANEVASKEIDSAPKMGTSLAASCNYEIGMIGLKPELLSLVGTLVIALVYWSAKRAPTLQES